MKIVNEEKIKENIFSFLQNRVSKRIYKQGLKKLSNNEILEQNFSFLERNIFIKTSLSNNISTEISINLENFEIKTTCSANCEKICESIAASLLYFISTFSFNYYNYFKNSISPINLIKKEDFPTEIKGILITEDKDYLCLILSKKGRFYLKKYLDKEADNKEFSPEFLLNYTKYNKTPLFFVKKSKRTVAKVFFSNENVKIILSIEKLNDNFVKVYGDYESSNEILKIFEGVEKRIILYKNGSLKILPGNINFKNLDKILQQPQVITLEDLNDLVCNEKKLNNFNIFFNKDNIEGFQVIDTEPTVDLYLDIEYNLLKLNIFLNFNEIKVNILGKNRIIKDKIIFKTDLEKNILLNLELVKAEIRKESFYIKGENIIKFLIEILSDKFSHFNIYGEEKLSNFKIRYPSIYSGLKIFSANEWFEIKGEIDFPDKKANLPDLIKSVKEKKKYIKLNKNTYGVIPDFLFERLTKLLDDENFYYDSHKKAFKIFKFNSINKENFFKDFVNAKDVIEEIKNLKNRLLNFKEIKNINIPKKFSNILREYQKDGVKWLFFLYENYLNGILADEMGLGKTIQALTFLSIIKSKTPNLIVVPTSLLYNWENEIKKFSYDFKYLIFYGKGREDLLAGLTDYKIILTTYNIVRMDFERLKEYEFNYIILDESQYIKNPSSVITRYIKKLKSKHRLSLTGTPFENSIVDIWSQFDFLHPGLLGTLKDFKKNYLNKVDSLKKKLSPLILRRRKGDVLTELPPKTEIEYFYDMNNEQKELYNGVKAFYLEKIMSSINQKGIKNSRLLIIEGLLRLRQICCHPKLVKFEHISYKSIKSEKFENLKKLINILLNKKNKIVIYSQFVQMLKIIKSWLKTLSIQFEYIDGTITNRFERINRFQNIPEIKIFLISLRAGGLGINLTSAENVIIYDPWWNPAVENQAIDRIHRIGQDKKVFVYKLLIKDSVEEKILHLQQKKKKIFDQLVEGDTILKGITKDDIEYIFS